MHIIHDVKNPMLGQAPDYTAADISEKVERIKASNGKKRKPTPKQRIEKARESFDRLREIVAEC